MTDEGPLRAVFDTNIIVAALLSRNTNSPLVELLSRWRRNEFVLLYCDDLLAEYREKLIAKRINPAATLAFLRDFTVSPVPVELNPADVLPYVPNDRDDDIVVACALVGGATHLVTYDPHIQSLGDNFHGMRILDGLHFFYVVRRDTRSTT